VASRTTAEGVTTAAGRTNTLVFKVAIAFGQPMPVVGDLAMFGENGSETIEAIFTKVEQGKNLSAILTFVDYAPEIYTY
jgi:hypothetical protein